MCKKITLFFVVLFCALFVFKTQAQERLWVADTQGRLHSMNTNGGDVFSNSQFGDPKFGSQVHGFDIVNNVPGYSGQLVIPTEYGDSYDNNYQGAINLVGPDGLRKIYNLDYQEDRAAAGIKATASGLIIASPDVIYAKWRGFVRIPYDGSEREYFTKPSTDFSNEYLLTTVGDTIYGVSKGDANNNGFIYRASPAELTNGPAIHVYDFTGSDPGTRPVGRLSYGNGFLFGVTKSGGQNNKGIFFKVKTDGSGFEKLFDRALTSLAKREPSGKYQTLLDAIAEGYVPVTDQQGNYFVYDEQGIYKVSPSGDHLALVSTVNAEKIELISPQFQHNVKVSNIQDGAIGVPTQVTLAVGQFSGAQLYQVEISTISDFSVGVQTQVTTSGYFDFTLAPGTTYYTRARTDLWPYYGNVKSFTTAGGPLETARRFYLNNITTSASVEYDGSDEHPFQESVYSDILQLDNGDKVYFGDTNPGAPHGDATLWKITPNGKEFLYQDLFNMRGINPKYMVDGGDGYFYGLSYSVVGSEAISMVRFKIDGSSVEELFVVGIEIPRSAYLTKTPNGIYGVTRGTGLGQGLIFKMRNDLSGLEPVFHFPGVSSGIRPYGKLLVGRDGFLYGTTRAGGANNAGVIYKIGVAGDQFEVLHDFVPLNGKNPETGLIQDSNGTLYGSTTIGGKNGYGVLYKIEEDGTGFQKLLDYFYTGRKNIAGSIAVDDSFVYATGGQDIFRINKDGTGYQPLGAIAYSFQSLPNTASNIAITNPINHTTPIDVNSMIAVSPISGAQRYYLEMSLSPVFDVNVITLTSDSAYFETSGLEYGKLYFVRARTNLSPSFGPVSTLATADVASHVYVIDPADGAIDFGEPQNSSLVQGWVTVKEIPAAQHYYMQVAISPGFEYGTYHDYEVEWTSGNPQFFATYLHYDEKLYARVRTNLSTKWGPITSFTTISSPSMTVAAPVEVYPNPSARSFTLKQREGAVQKVVITDLSGNVLYQNNSIGEGESFGEDLKKGIYILTLQRNDGIRTIRLVKE